MLPTSRHGRLAHTMLADGADPFSPPGGQSPSLSCRLYAGGQGRPGPAPSIAQLRAALGL